MNALRDKDGSHLRIEQAAARILRRDGMAGASVRRVMGKAGLTIGGFYAHFSSRERLLQEAFSRGLAQRRRVVAKKLGEARGAAFVDGFLRAYLSREHRDAPETGCPYAALLSELPRSSRSMRRRVREEFVRGVDSFVGRLQERSPAEARRKALLVLSLAFGALALARALKDFPEGDAVLRAAAGAARHFTGEEKRK